MIDTDKYKGHTEGPWELIEREGTGLFNLVMWRREEKKPVAYAYNSGKYTYEYPNAQLMADAPLLLAEVKDLQKKLDNLREYCHAEGYDIFNWEVKNIEVIE